MIDLPEPRELDEERLIKLKRPKFRENEELLDKGLSMSAATETKLRTRLCE